MAFKRSFSDLEHTSVDVPRSSVEVLNQSDRNSRVTEKPRFEGGEDIFARFNNNQEMVAALTTCCRQLRQWKHYALTSMTIHYCNASTGKDYGFSFSDAQCLTEFYSERIFSFLKFFSHGKTILESYTEMGKIPENQYHRLVLRRLLMYILDCKDDQEALRRMTLRSELPESTLAVAFGEHLLSKLSVTASYTLDRLYNDCHISDMHKSMKICPCGCQNEFSGLYGDNSIGNSKCWHGNIDILFPGADLAVSVGQEHISHVGKSSEEVEAREDVQSDKATQQALAKTIVFSFFQKKLHPERDHFLVPTMGISKKEIIFYLYDSEKDILMKSPPFSLFTDSETMNLETILACWLVLHNQAFGSGIPDDVAVKIPRANFCTLAKDKLGIYKNELNLGGVRSKSFNFHYQPHVWHNAEFCK